MSSSVKLKLCLNKEQKQLFQHFSFAKQLFRNHSIDFLRKRYKQKRAWIKQNKNTKEYIAWQEDIKNYSEKIKVFKQTYKTKQMQDNAQKQGLKPIFPKSIHPLLDDQISCLSSYLTEELEKSKVWLLKNLARFSHMDGVVIPKKNPKAFYEFYNTIPFSVKRSLTKQARNEKVLLYLLQAPRGVFDQTIQDLKKTYAKAYDNLKNGVAVNQAGFPNFKKIKNHGSVRVQLDSRNKKYTAYWDEQELFIPSLGILSFRDQGYILPQDYAKMITIKKTPTGKFFATFVGVASYNEKRLKQKERSKARIPEVSPATSAQDFLDNHTASFDINRKAGFPVVVCNIAQDNTSQKDKGITNQEATKQLAQTSEDIINQKTTKNHTVSLLDQTTLEKLNNKMKRKDKYIRFQQKRLARQDAAKRQQKKKGKRNPNGLHRNSKHSARRQKTQVKINFAFEALNNLKSFYLLALAKKMVQGKKVVFIEDLDVKGLLEKDKPKNKTTKHHQNDKHSQHTACFGKLISFVRQECEKRGVILLECGRYDATSQICHLCGFNWGKIDTNVRKITCPDCKETHDRDYNATQNIKFLALYRYLEDKSSHVKLSKDSKTISLGERLNDGKAVSSFFKISHEELMAYINRNYPIEKVIKALPRKIVLKDKSSKQTCGNRYHASFSKRKAA